MNKKKVAVVTGSNRGIGWNIACKLVDSGLTVAFTARSTNTLEKKIEFLNKNIDNVQIIKMDVTNQQQVKDAISNIIKKNGSIDILVNNAGINEIIKFIDLDFSDWKKILNVNLHGTFLVTKAVIPYMIKQKSGRIINMSSQAGKFGEAYNSSYCASKFAIIGFTQSLAHELAPFNIMVNAICPGPVETDMMTNAINRFAYINNVSFEEYRHSIIKRIPNYTLLSPKDVANAVAFLASDAACSITGASIPVTGGITMW